MSVNKSLSRISRWRSIISTYLPGIGIIFFIFTVTVLFTLFGGVVAAAAPATLLLRKRTTLAEQHPIAIENIINNVRIYNQEMPAAVLLNSGNLLVSWTSVGQDSDREGVFANILDVQGNKLLSQEVQFNSATYDAQLNSQVIAIGNNSIGMWLSSVSLGTSNNVILRQFDQSANSKGSEVTANSVVKLPRVQPRLVELENQIFTAWTSYSQVTSQAPNIFGRIFNATLAPSISEFRLDSATNAYLTGLAVMPNNTVLATWQTSSYNSVIGSNLNQIYAQRFNVSGQKVGTTFLVNTNTNYDQVESVVATLPNGYVVAWQSTNQVSSNSNLDIYAQWFDELDNKLGNEIQVNTYTLNSQQNAVLTVLPDGSVMISWQSKEQDGSDWGVYAQWFDINGNKLGREFQVNSIIDGPQDAAVITTLPNGNVAFIWQSNGQDGSGYGIIHKVLTPRLDPFIYNADIPLTLDQNTPQNGTNFVLNPMVDADTVTVTLTPSAGINLSTVNTTSYSYGNAAVIKDADTGEISISGHAVPVNLALNQLVITPTRYFSGNASIAIYATDGGAHADFNATVSVDVVPVAYKPDLTAATQIDIYQNIPFTLTSNLFNASNPDTNVHRPIAYDIGSALRITFFNTTTNPAEQVISFTDEELSNGVIEARPDDSGLSPSFTLQARDRVTSLTSAVTSVTVAFTARPVLELGAFAISSDEVFTFTTDNLKTNAGVYPVNSVWQFSAIQNAQIINPKTNTKWPIGENGLVTVTQDALVNGLVGIKPNGKSTSPAFNVAFGIPTNVPGQHLYSRTSAAQINFNYVAKDNKALIGGVVGGVGGLIALSALGIGIFACVRKNKKEQALLDAQEASRQNEPLANAVWEKLGSPEDYADFTSEAGLAFVAAINKIAAKMNQQLSYKDNYIYFAEKFVEAMNQHQITADHISDNIPKISSYINKNWDEAKAVQAQEESKVTANREYEVELTPV